MGKQFTREEILERLRREIKEGKPILGAGCSAGIIAKCAEIGGADLIIIYSSGLSRLRGVPTTPYGSLMSNPTTLEMFDEIDNVLKDTPIIAGVDASDPYRSDLKKLLKMFWDKGFSGIINFPTVVLYGDRWIESRSSVGYGFEREIKMMEIARSMDLFTMAYVWSPRDARKMAKVPVDVMCPHAGGTAGGLVGFKAEPYEVAVKTVQSMIKATKEVNPDIICLAHGGPFAEPKDTIYLYEHTDAAGFVGASSIERIPVEKAVIECCKGFKSMSIRAHAK